MTHRAAPGKLMPKRKTIRRARRKRIPANVAQPSSDPKALAARLLRLLEAEIRSSETAAERLGSVSDAIGTADRTRTLGALARALQAVSSLSAAARPRTPDEPDDPPARTVEELEHSLLKHLEDFERERADELARKNEAG